MDNLSEEIKKLEEQIQEKQNTPVVSVKNDLKLQYERNKQEVLNSEQFQQITKEITERITKAELGEDMLKVLSKEQQNELALHILNCEKEKIKYRQKKEKRIALEEVKSEVFNRRVEALKNKYGYLYEKDDKGEIKNFVPSKIYNKYRAFCNWYDNTTDNFKKIAKGTIKVFLGGLAVCLFVVLGYKLFAWIKNIQLP